jgi:hypothetical protein
LACYVFPLWTLVQQVSEFGIQFLISTTWIFLFIVYLITRFYLASTMQCFQYFSKIIYFTFLVFGWFFGMQCSSKSKYIFLLDLSRHQDKISSAMSTGSVAFNMFMITWSHNDHMISQFSYPAIGWFYIIFLDFFWSFLGFHCSSFLY